MNGFKGNFMYQSKFVYEGHTISRRDDILSALYIMIRMVQPKFFAGLSTSIVTEQFKFFKLLKCSRLEFMLEDDVSNHFMKVMEYTQSLKFEDKPDYKMIKFLLRKICLD